MQYRRCLLYSYYLRKYLENKEGIFLLTPTSSKEKVFHWHVPHLQQKASRDGKKKNKRKATYQSVQDFFCNQKKVVWFLGFVYCMKLPFVFVFCRFLGFLVFLFTPPSLPRSLYAYHITWKFTVKLKKRLESAFFLKAELQEATMGVQKGQQRKQPHCQQRSISSL